jgi:antitoxin component YwqK of YwqJK toxin-antitoxin module
LYADVNYTNGILNGSYKTFYYNGKLELNANLHSGKFNGPVQTFYEDGSIQLTCNFKNDSLHGDFISYSKFPNKKEEAHFENNNLQGDYIVYSDSVQIPFIKINADKNILRNKKVFSDEGKLLEEISFKENSEMQFCADIAGYQSFLELRKAPKGIEGEEKMFASYKAFYENGKTLCEGEIVKGFPNGQWKFYNVQGVLINEVIFADTSFLSPGDYEAKKYYASITGYFNNGKIRCKGFVREWESGYDCSTYTDKTKFAIFYTDAWTYEGTQVIKNGTGKGIISDENGIKISSGELVNYKEEGVWKYFDPNQKLNETGKYISGSKDGLWYSGDLENLNFEDAACFDANNKSAQQALDYSKKVIKLTTELYRNGALMDSQTFETDLNTERDKNFRQKF